MGKASFPLVNVRKKITGEWNLYHYSGLNAETIEVPLAPTKDGLYIVSLTEVPDPTIPPHIPGFTEHTGAPFNPKSGALDVNPGTFYVNYQTGELLFNPADAGKKFDASFGKGVEYYGRGSLIEAEDINNLEERIRALETAKNSPTILDFRLNGGKYFYDINEEFPRTSSSTENADFTWLFSDNSGIMPNTVTITDVYSNAVIASTLPASPSNYVASYPVGSKIVHMAPQTNTFKLTAVTNSGTTLEKTFDVKWVDRIYYGSVSSKSPTPYEITDPSNKSVQLKDVAGPHSFTLDFPPTTASAYRFIAVPLSMRLTSAVDVATSMTFVFDSTTSTLPLNFLYGSGTINYAVYISTNQFVSSLTLDCTAN